MSKRTRCRAGHHNPTSETRRRQRRAPLGPAFKVRRGRLYWARKVRQGEVVTMDSACLAGMLRNERERTIREGMTRPDLYGRA